MSQHHLHNPHHKSTVQEFTHKVRKHKSGAAAYARAARRYGFETNTFVGREGVVFRRNPPTGDHGTTSSDSEVPAQNIENGMLS